MAKSQRFFEKDREVDRILSLPRNIIDCIIESMPVRDAARTCVLSSKWRYVWAGHPSLILDKGFWDDVQRNRLPNKLYMDFLSVVNSILLYHVEPIRKFVIDVSVVSCVPHSSIDLWLSSLSRRNLQELDFRNSKTRSLYKVPSWLFSISELTHLSLSNCLMKTIDNVGCFSNIKCLVLKQVNLDSCVLTTSHLTSLTLMNCRGIHGFNIVAPRLGVLSLFMNDHLNLKPYLTCTLITDARFYSARKIEHSEECESVNLVKLASSWPMISVLGTEGFCLKYLTAGKIHAKLQLNLRSFVLCNVDLDLDLIAPIFCILKNSPLLQTFEIRFSATSKLEEVYHIDEPSIMDYKIEQLCTVKMKKFTASRVEVMFLGILLRSAPLLGKMLVQEDDGLDPAKRIKILKELLLLQRAFPKTQIIFSPNIS